MWKVCQLLKVGRCQFSRSCNANNLSSPNQPASSSISLLQNENGRKHLHSTKQHPIAFTPSVFRSWDHDQKCHHHTVARIRSTSVDGGNLINESHSFGDEKFDQEHAGGYGNDHPGHDNDRWHCRCHCRFGDWFGYTTMVAATIQLSRVTIYLLPGRKDDSDIHQSGSENCCGGRISSFDEFKDTVQTHWQLFLLRAGPVLFPDVFKRWYVLPPDQEHRLALALSTLQKPQNRAAQRIDYDDSILIFDESLPSSSSSTPSTNDYCARSTSEDCAVQTDATGSRTPFDDSVLGSARRLAAFSRLTDVGLEHAIGVDFLKRSLYDEAVDYLLGAARSGHAGALYNLGICYSRGYGVRKDMTKAVESWRAAADQGHGLSKYQMGACHARGLGGLAMDHDRAVRYMEAAASAGVPEAKTFLAANKYKQGRLEGALELLRQAVAGGDAKASELLNDLPASSKSNQQSGQSSDGYVFENLAKAKAAPPMHSTIRQLPNSGRRRFWASSSSDKDESLSCSSSSSGHRAIESSRNSSSSVLFCDDVSTDSGEAKTESKQWTAVEISSSRAIGTVASLLSLGPLRRSMTAPDFRCHDKIEVALVTTGKVEWPDM